jgi:CO/xanthine dehydrogenase Mo-binding subunit
MHGRLIVVTSTQIPFHVRRILSTALRIPESRIRVIKPRIGGGFGAKQTATAEFYPALVTLKTGKSAKIVYTRKEVFRGTNSRHEMKFDVTIGATKDGKIKAIDMKGISNTGAYGEHCQTTIAAAGKKVLPLYNKVDACRYYGKAVYTNKVPGAALRGFGVSQGTFAVESAINELAVELNMDPTTIRDINMIKKGKLPSC